MINIGPRSVLGVVICLTMVLLSIGVLSSCAMAAAPAGYSNQVQHAITGSSDGLLSSYVKCLVVYNTTGTNNGNVLYVGAACRSDFNDLVIMDSTENTVLPRWIDWASSGDNYIVLYYNITTSIPSTGTVLNIYYGNPSATNTDNPYAVWQFFDPFTTLDTNNWTVSGSASVADGILTVPSGTTSYVYGDTNYAIGWSAVYCIKYAAGAQGYSGWENGVGITANVNMDEFDNSNCNYGNDVSSGNSGHGSTLTGSFHTLEISRATGHTRFYVDRFLKVDETTIVSTSNRNIIFYAYALQLDVTWIGIRRTTANEPTDGGWNTGNTAADMVQTVKYTLIKIDPFGLYIGGVPYCSVKAYDSNNLLVASNVQTGTDGSISFMLYRSRLYTLIFTNLSVGVNKTWTGYPADSEYVVYVWPWELEWTPGEAGPDSEYKIVESFMTAQLNESDQNNGDITVYYNDTGAHTSTTTINVYKRLNMTNEELIDTYTTTDNNFSHKFTVLDAAGEDYKVVVSADNSYYGVVTRSFAWTFPGVRYNIPGLPLMAYVWIGFIVPIFVALTVSMRNVKFGPIVFCIMSWGFNTLGWMSQLGAGYTLVLAVATFFSVLFIFNVKAKEGGF